MALPHTSDTLTSRVTAGFEVADAVALLRLSDLYIESFEVKDVKVLIRCTAAMHCHGGPHLKFTL